MSELHLIIAKTREAGLEALAEEAESGDWSHYMGPRLVMKDGREYRMVLATDPKRVYGLRPTTVRVVGPEEIPLPPGFDWWIEAVTV